MKDIVQERADKGICPICTKELGSDYKRIEYKGKKIMICPMHNILNNEEG